MNNIWLVPASDKTATLNLPRSLTDEIRVDLRAKLRASGINSQHAWGARVGKKEVNLKKLNEMSPGDICLFYTQGIDPADSDVKAYRWVAVVEAPLCVDEALAREIWYTDVAGLPFSLIYFISKPTEIFLPVEALGELLDPSGQKYQSPAKGIMSLDPNKTLDVSKRFNGLAGFLDLIYKSYAVAPPEQLSDVEIEELAQEESIELTDSVLKPIKKVKGKPRSGVAGSPISRRSEKSKLVGDAAELVVLNYLRGGNNPDVDVETVAHVANLNCGWDIEYKTLIGELYRVEVKGSVSGSFSSFDLTVNELDKLYQETNYHIYLVGDCLKPRKRIQVIENLKQLLEEGQFQSAPIVFRIESAS